MTAVFVFTDAQLIANPYRSDAAVGFLLDSLIDLDAAIRKKRGSLHFRHGRPEEILGEFAADAVYVNEDYTPFSRERDEKIRRACEKKGMEFISCADAMLTRPGVVLTGGGTPYTVFTPFFAKASQLTVPPPKPAPRKSTFTLDPRDGLKLLRKFDVPRSLYPGGRRSGLAILQKSSRYAAYAKERDFPHADRTTHLSPHLKFGTVSVREAYHSLREGLGQAHPLLRQLYWRDFFTHVLFHFPIVLGHAFQARLNKIKWDNRPELLDAWKNGRTGYPIVDAGMRQLNETGWMHNRVRMITASFLVKDLLIDWRKGEEYFASRLVDYDPAVNNGNWQWAASTGCDAVPYFRIFHPVLQQKKFDPDASYIRRWIPELRDFPADVIHRASAAGSGIGEYPPHVVEHDEQRKKVIERFKKARSPA